MLNLIQHPLFQGIAGQARNDGASKAPKSRRDDLLLTDGFNRRMSDCATARVTPQSRRDDPLLTDGFNRRMSGNVRPLQSPEGTALCRTAQVSSLRDFGAVHRASLVRRLKSTVNKVPSLQDYSPFERSEMVADTKNSIFKRLNMVAEANYTIFERLELVADTNYTIFERLEPGIREDLKDDNSAMKGVFQNKGLIQKRTTILFINKYNGSYW